MNIKSVLIPVAAFAVTVTGASAFSPELLEKAGLSNEQISAFEEAKELREAGDKDAARDVLVAAGIDEETMQKIREAMREAHDEYRVAIRTAVENNDYEAFLVAIDGSPLAEIIDTEAEFASFVEAHELMEGGDRESAKEIMDDLGIQRLEGKGHFIHKWGDGEPPFFSDLTDEQKAEFKEAVEDHDHEKVKELLEEYGVDLKVRGEGKGFIKMKWKDGEDE